jgi:SagB-type dehydrogenase family enzyme
MTDAGRRFQKETKYDRSSLAGRRLDWSARPGTYKAYPDAPRFELPKPEASGGPPLWEVIARRRSRRSFARRSLPVETLSQLLWAAQGVSARTQGLELRTTPSAGALYPVETYVLVQSVDGLEPGVYHYDVRGHTLEKLSAGDPSARASEAALSQGFTASANVVFVWTAVFGRSVWKYAERAYRYVYLDAGHIAQNVALAAVALGLGSCPIAALFDDEVNALLGVDGEAESALYMTAVGRPGTGAKEEP